MTRMSLDAPLDDIDSILQDLDSPVCSPLPSKSSRHDSILPLSVPTIKGAAEGVSGARVDKNTEFDSEIEKMMNDICEEAGTI